MKISHIISLILSLLSFNCWAQHLEYKVISTEDKTVEVSKWGDWTEEDLSIPAYITKGDEEYKVVKISRQSFRYCSNIKRVFLPETIIEIGEHAFTGCINISSVSNLDKVSILGEQAFYGCEKLKEVNLCPNLLSINGAFAECKGLVSIDIPDGIKELVNNEFYGCTSLSDVKLPSALEKIGHAAFFNCESLVSIDFPLTLTYIGYKAFYGCTKLEQITLHENLSTLGYGAFMRCSGIKNVIYNPSKCEGVTSSSGNAHYSMFESCENLTNINIGENVKVLPKSIFGGCGISYINIPNSVESIGILAFSYCINLEEVNIGKSVTNIGGSAFYGCELLKKIDIQAEQPPVCDDNVFYEVDTQNCTLVVPDNSYELYSRANTWKDFIKIQTSGVSEIKIDNSMNDRTYYDLYGREVQNPQNGLYIQRKGKITSKVFIP